MPGGLYSGVVLIGSSDITFHKKGKVYAMKEIPELIKELKDYDSKDELLKDVAKIINEIPITSLVPEIEGTFLMITGELLSTPRKIHNILRSLKVNEENRKALKAIFMKLSFDTKTLNPRDPREIQRIFRIAKGTEFLGDNEPMSIRDEAMFTKDIIVSSFASFGATAPSFFDETGTALPILRLAKKAKEVNGVPSDQLLVHERRTAKGATVIPRGLIPVFIKSTPQCVNDYNNMLRNRAMAFKLTARGGVANAAFVVDKSNTDSIAKMLVDCFAAPKSTEKRKFVESVDELTSKELGERSQVLHKRARRAEEAAAVWEDMEM
jgi:hypothetical protein